MAKNIVCPLSRRNSKNKNPIWANAFYIGITTLLCLLTLIAGLSCARSPQILNLTANDIDTDKDGISDAQELNLGTNPNNPDTDHDGLTDSSELRMDLNPLNRDSDGDGSADADDFMPTLNNTTFFLGGGISLAIFLVVGLILFQTRIGFTKERKKKIVQIKVDTTEKNKLIETEANRILELAQKKYGSLTLGDMTEELKIDPIILEQCLSKLKAKKDGKYYHFAAVERTFTK